MEIKKILEERKNFLLIVLLIIILLILFLFTDKKENERQEVSKKIDEKIEEEIVSEKKDNSNKICYGGSFFKTKNQNIFNDLKYMEINLENKPAVNGFAEFGFGQKKIDGKIVGALQDNYLNIIIDLKKNDEGIAEQYLFMVDSDGLIPSFNLKKSLKNKVLMIDNVEKAVFNKNFKINSIECR